MTNTEIKSLIEDTYECKISLDRVHFNEDNDTYDVDFAHCGKKHYCRISEETKEVQNMELGEPFEWHVKEGPGDVTVFKLNHDTSKDASKDYNFIGNKTKSVIELALRNDKLCTRGKGLADGIKEELAPYVDSIICIGLLEGTRNEESRINQFEPMTRFLVEGHLPMSMDEDKFQKELFAYILEQCSDLWGENFAQTPVKSETKRNSHNQKVTTETYFSPWKPGAKVSLE